MRELWIAAQLTGTRLVPNPASPIPLKSFLLGPSAKIPKKSFGVFAAAGWAAIAVRSDGEGQGREGRRRGGRGSTVLCCSVRSCDLLISIRLSTSERPELRPVRSGYSGR